MIEDLEREAVPPEALKARVTASLEAAGRLEPACRPDPEAGEAVGRRLGSRSARAPHAARAVIGIAAALVLFLVGVSVGSRTAPAVAPSPEGVGGRYLLVLYEDDSFRPDRPIEELVAEYGAWASSSWPNGSVATGEQLGEGGWLLEGEGGEASALASGPLGDVTGYFVITATEDSAAREIAASCPHLRYGGRVALQPIAGP